MKAFSTSEVAKAIGVNKSTLLRWLYSGTLKEPRKIVQPGVESRVWTERDVERAQKHKDLHYRKGRGRPANWRPKA
jgi:DNA-binding transcriptional MerR regulator